MRPPRGAGRVGGFGGRGGGRAGGRGGFGGRGGGGWQDQGPPEQVGSQRSGVQGVTAVVVWCGEVFSVLGSARPRGGVLCADCDCSQQLASPRGGGGHVLCTAHSRDTRTPLLQKAAPPTLLVRLFLDHHCKRAQVVEAGNFSHPCEGEAVCKLTNEKVRGRGLQADQGPAQRTQAYRGLPWKCLWALWGARHRTQRSQGGCSTHRTSRRRRRSLDHRQPMHLSPAAAHTE